MLIFFQPPPHLPKARGARSFRCSLRLIFTGVVWNQAAIVMGFPAGGGIFAITPVSLCMAACTPDLFREKQKPIHLGMTKNGDNGVTLSCLLIMFPGPMRQTLETLKIPSLLPASLKFSSVWPGGTLITALCKDKGFIPRMPCRSGPQAIWKLCEYFLAIVWPLRSTLRKQCGKNNDKNNIKQYKCN